MTTEGEQNHHRTMGTVADKAIRAEPSNYHKLLAYLAGDGKLQRNYTQNIDELDTRYEQLQTKVPLPSCRPWPPSIQLHGSLRYTYCTACKDLRELQPSAHVNLDINNPSTLSCALCQFQQHSSRPGSGPGSFAKRRKTGAGRLRPNIILYDAHEADDPDADAKAKVITQDSKSYVDVMIVAGTRCTLGMARRTVRALAGAVKARGGTVIWVCKDPPPSDGGFRDLFNYRLEMCCEDFADVVRALLRKKGDSR